MTIKEKAKRAWEDYCYRADGSLYSTVFEDAYKQGATEALASQWVSVEERLPERHEEVLTYRIGALNENAVAYHDGANWYTTDGEHIRPHYWLPIPPLKGDSDTFDETDK